MGAKTHLRCERCQKLLAIDNGDHDFEIKCTRCGKLNLLLNTFHEQVVVTDPSGKILYVNGELERITGYSIEEAIGQKPSLWGKQMPEEFYKKLWHVISFEKKSVQVNLVNRHKNGTLYNARLQISPVFNADGEIVFFVGVERVVA